MKWISVDDRLPAVEEDCDGFYFSCKVIYYDGKEVGVCGFSSGNTVGYWSAFEYDGITHWMPLPGPPA